MTVHRQLKGSICRHTWVQAGDVTEQEEERLEIVGAQKLKERLPKFIMQEGTIPMYRWSEEYINQSINQSIR